MPSAEDRQQLIAPIHTLQIVITAMVCGVVVFGLVCPFVQLPGQEAADLEKPPLLTYFALAYALCAIGMGAALPTLVTRIGRSRIARGQKPRCSRPFAGMSQAFIESDTGRLFVLYFWKTVIAAAMFEGAGLLLVIAYLVERRTFALAPAGVMAIAIALFIPSRDRVERWLAAVDRSFDQDRQPGGDSASGF